jgi:hypothetical protein
MGYSNRPGMPSRVIPLRNEERDEDDYSGDAGKDGYTRLSIASRRTGSRETVGSEREYPPFRYED